MKSIYDSLVKPSAIYQPANFPLTFPKHLYYHDDNDREFRFGRKTENTVVVLTMTVVEK